MSDERWQPIRKNPRYFVSDRGRVVGPNRYPVSQFLDSNGYPCISFPGLTRCRVHNLVTDAFIGKKPHKYQVNHKDGVKTNNHVENLEYVTQADNLRHAFRTGLIKNVGRRRIHE